MDEKDENKSGVASDFSSEPVVQPSAPAPFYPEKMAEQPIPAVAMPESDISLLSRHDLALFRTRWDEIQVNFVDEPREAVIKADTLMTEVVEKYNQKITSDRDALKGKYDPSKTLSTEDLRKALLEYRTFVNRLIS